jgi:hypothetical protein
MMIGSSNVHGNRTVPGSGFRSPIGLSALPVIVRLAGLTAAALEPLASPSCVELLQARRPLDEELGSARLSMVEVIGGVLPRLDSAARRFLLTIKRSCFNGREIGTHRGKAGWAELLRVAPDLAERIVTLESQLIESDRAFTALYESELVRERRHLLDLLGDRRFLRGVALGRLGLVRKAHARASSLNPPGSLKNPMKWEQSLLRFVTRAAAKLSANSTLTTYALGSVQTDPSLRGFRFDGSPQRETSLVRVNRPEIEQVQALLMRHPAVRAQGWVAWNDTVEELAPGQYRFLREGYWDLDPGADRFCFVRPARVTVELRGPLLDAARDALRDGALRYDVLSALLAEGRGSSAGTIADPEEPYDLDQLVDVGLLLLMPPWPAHEPWLERRIGQLLRDLPGEPSLRRTADALDELVALEEGFAASPQPESAVAHMEEAFSRLLGTVTPLADREGPLAASRPEFFEDVLFEPAVRSEDDRGVFQIAAPAVQEILRCAGPLSRFAGLFNHRHDVLHTLAAWWRLEGPSRREAPFLEIAQGFAPYWKQFLQFHKTANESALNTFDPLRANALEALRESRKLLLSKAEELLLGSPAKDFLAPEELQELLRAVSRRYAPLLGSCVFVQPVDAAGGSFVLNRLHEGTGRYLSRVTPVLEGPPRQRFLAHLSERSVVDLDGEEADLLEVMQPWGSLVGAHPPQAVKVLALRGLHLDVARERRVGLGDLVIDADLDRETFRLLDGSGRRVLPVHLSSMADAGLPPLLRFLLTFGPGETRGVFPPAHAERGEGVRSFNRLTCGSLVIRRRRWLIGVESLRADLASLSGHRAYARIQGWRDRLDLPRTAFYSERTYHGAVKPQYIDFSSPSLCGVFVSSLQKMATVHLLLEEALPSPADFPFDASMSRRGLELLIDSLVIRAAGDPSFAARSHNRESPSLRKEWQNA